MRRTDSAAQILKNGTIINTVSVGGKDLVMIGRNADTCDIALDHPSVSRHHIAVQFKEDGCAYVFDMSTHGTRLNKRQLKSRVYARLRVGDVLQVGQSSRLLIFSGPEHLVEPVEGGWGTKRSAAKPPPPPKAAPKAAARLLPPQPPAALALGRPGGDEDFVSWGFGEDAEEVDDSDEQLTDLVI